MNNKKKTYNTLCVGGITINIGENCIDEIKQTFRLHNYQNVLIITDKGIISNQLLDYVLKPVKELNMSFYIFSNTQPNPPLSQVEEVVSLVRQLKSDVLIAMGGGSVIDLAKAAGIMATNEGHLSEYIHSLPAPRVFIRESLPLYTVPTTSGTGSEVTQYAVITDTSASQKITIGSPLLVSKSVFLDPRLTLSLPPAITASTGIDALAHALEAFTSERIIHAPGSSVISDALALKALDLILEFLPKAYVNGTDMEARKEMMLGSTTAGLITQAGSGAAHGLSHCLTSRFGIPHGEAIGALLPSVMRFNLSECRNRYEIIARSCKCIISKYGINATAENLIDYIEGLLKTLHQHPLSYYISDASLLDGLLEEACADKCTVINACPVHLQDAYAIYHSSYK